MSPGTASDSWRKQIQSLVGLIPGEDRLRRAACWERSDPNHSSGIPAPPRTGCSQTDAGQLETFVIDLAVLSVCCLLLIAQKLK